MLRKPIGGYKIVYEYANRLTKDGYRVAILFLNERALCRFHIPKLIKNMAIDIFTMIEPRWFSLDKRVIKISSTTPRVNEVLREYDLAIATGVDTVKLTRYFFQDKRKAYFIQDYEKWVYSEEVVNQSFGLGMDNIVVSRWLKNVVDIYGNKPAILIRNPVDTDIYKVYKPIQERNKYTLGVLYHTAAHKGFKYAYKAILELKKKCPELQVKMFGTSIPNFELPKWIQFTLNASQSKTVDIYNSVSVFLCATVQEGFGLTGLEAMACGAALVSTEYLGVKEYAVNNVNALLSPVGNVNALSENVYMLFQNDELRVRLASQGKEDAKMYSWKNALKKMECYIDGSTNIQ